MYDTAEEAKQKLVDSVVLYDGRPVYVSAAGGKKGSVNLHFKPLPLNPREDIHSDNTIRTISETGWDFRSLGTRLGFTEVANPYCKKLDSVYLSRVPIRHSRQGLDNKTTQLLCYDRDYEFSWNNIIYDSDGLAKTVANSFRSPKEAFNLLSNTTAYKSIPIHRKLALIYDHVSPPCLLYRMDKIGYTEDGLTFRLAKHKEYLREELVDMMGLKIA